MVKLIDLKIYYLVIMNFFQMVYPFGKPFLLSVTFTSEVRSDITQIHRFLLHFFWVHCFDQFGSIGVSCRLWGTLLADVVIQMLGTDYARILRAIYAFAQVIYELVCMIF